MFPAPVIIIGVAVIVAGATLVRRYSRKKERRREKMRAPRTLFINTLDDSDELASELAGIRLIVTHYGHGRPLKGIWVPLRFLTRDVLGTSDFYYVGYQTYTISQESVDLLVAQGEITPVHPMPIALNQRLWLTPFGELVIAKKENPEHDRLAVHVGKMPAP